jgi:hypothetical protein
MEVLLKEVMPYLALTELVVVAADGMVVAVVVALEMLQLAAAAVLVGFIRPVHSRHGHRGIAQMPLNGYWTAAITSPMPRPSPGTPLSQPQVAGLKQVTLEMGMRGLACRNH